MALQVLYLFASFDVRDVRFAHGTSNTSNTPRQVGNDPDVKAGQDAILLESAERAQGHQFSWALGVRGAA